MENAIKLLQKLWLSFPKTLVSWSYWWHARFYPSNSIEGKLESTKIELILRDFVTAKLDEQKTIWIKSVKKGITRLSHSVTNLPSLNNIAIWRCVGPTSKGDGYCCKTVENIGWIPNKGPSEGYRWSCTFSQGSACPNLLPENKPYIPNTNGYRYRTWKKQ